jgi:hypothetical protein
MQNLHLSHGFKKMMLAAIFSSTIISEFSPIAARLSPKLIWLEYILFSERARKKKVDEKMGLTHFLFAGAKWGLAGWRF